MKALLPMLLLSMLVLGSLACRSTDNQNAASQNANSAQPSANNNVSTANSNNAAPNGTSSQEKPSSVDRYRINASASRFSAHVAVGGLLSSLGHDHTVAIRDFTGEAHITPGAVEPASLQLTIKAGSLVETEQAISEADRQKIDRAINEEALETAKYPQIVFKSTKISAKKTGDGQYQVQINGELTLHGVTRPVAFPAQVTLKGNTLSARGEFTVRHSDYQIKRLSAGGGTVKAKEEIRLSFNIVGSKA